MSWWPFKRKPKAFAELEAQTASGNAAALARHGAAQRKREAKARQDEMTERLRMFIRAEHIAKERERTARG